MDCSLPGFSVHGIFQTRVLEWGAIAFSEDSPTCLFLLLLPLPLVLNPPKIFTRLMSRSSRCYAGVLSHFSHVRLFVTLWTVASRLLCPWESPGKNTRVVCHAFFQGIFLIHSSNPCLLLLLHCSSFTAELPGKPQGAYFLCFSWDLNGFRSYIHVFIYLSQVKLMV